MVDINTALNTIRTVIDSNVIDVWELASNRSRSADQRIFFNDLRLTGGVFPKIFIETEDGDNTKLNWGGKKNMHKNRETFTVNIYYVNTARVKYTLNGTIYENGGANTSSDLNIDRLYIEVTYTAVPEWQGTINGIQDPAEVNGVVATDIDNINGVSDATP